MCLVSFISTLYAEFRCRRSYRDEQKNQAWKSNENTEMLEKVNNVATSEDAEKVVRLT